MSYFHNVMHLLTQLTDNEMLVLALTETAKLVPYVTGSRKSVKVYLKVCGPLIAVAMVLKRSRQTCLDLWSSAEDSVRIAAFLSVRKLASATDSSLMDLALKVGCTWISAEFSNEPCRTPISHSFVRANRPQRTHCHRSI